MTFSIYFLMECNRCVICGEIIEVRSVTGCEGVRSEKVVLEDVSGRERPVHPVLAFEYGARSP